MPYGTVTFQQTNGIVQGSNCYPFPDCSNYTCLGSSSSPAHGKASYVRSGSNAPVAKRKGLPFPPGTFRLVPVRVAKGARLSYKVYSKRLKRFVFARQLITVYRYERVKSKSVPKKSLKGLDLMPNSLNYSSNQVSYFGGNLGVLTDYVGLHWSGWSRRYSGPLWHMFTPMGSYTALGPNPQNYWGATIDSGRFVSAETSLSSSLLTKLYDKVKNQKVNLGQALAERAQTAGLLADAAIRAAKALKALRAGNLSSAAKTLFPGGGKQMANDWLVYQYGIKPLISDIKGAAELLATPNELQYDVIVKKKLIHPRLKVDEESNSASFPHVTTCYSEGYTEVTYKVRLKVTSAGARVFNEVGLANLPAIGWELLPYSFIIDWLLPIGNYLNNQDAFDNLEVVYATKTVFHKENVTFERVCGGNAGGYIYPTQTVGFINTRVSCVRSLITIPKLPTPSFKDPVSAGHIANAIALIRQRFK